jgi:tRNA pseudouridine38-40 synthase
VRDRTGRDGQKWAAVVAYDGTEYAGFQVQPKARTVQAELERALAAMHKREVRITASGRTDAGVHARGQVIHFVSSLNITARKWPVALNTNLPRDIRVIKTTPVGEHFHARYDSLWKEYRYTVDTSDVQDPLRRLYAHHVPRKLNQSIMVEAARCLEGTHDFTAFSSAKAEVDDKRRTLYGVHVDKKGTELVIRVSGNGFLYNMVRIIAGTLLEVGQGRMTQRQVQQALHGGDRNLAGHTAPAHGLCLWKVAYPQHI